MNTLISQADKLYKLLVTRTNAYQVLLQASMEANQSGVVCILERGEHEHKLAEALRDCYVAEFICRCQISTSDFESIIQAIENYAEVTQFTSAFQNDVEKKPWLLQGPKKETLLHIATAFGYIDLMQYFIKLGVEVNAKDTEGRTAGHYIGKFSTNVLETTKVLLTNGLHIHHVDLNGITAASTVAIYNNITRFHYYHWVDHIINNGHQDIFVKQSNMGETPFHFALKTMDMEKTTLRLVYNGDRQQINITDNTGRTILHIASMFGRNLVTVKNLIDLGADYEMRDEMGESVVHFAVRGGNIEVLRFLVKIPSDINLQDKHDETPLHKLRFSKNRDFLGLTKLLLDFGANLSATDKTGNTFAHLFSSAESVSTDDFHIWVKGLIEFGYAYVFAIRNCNGTTPLQSTMEYLDVDLITIKRILESSKVDINQPDNNGLTLLQLALINGRNMQTIKSLIQLGANFKTTDTHGFGVLHKAIFGGRKEVIEYLISLGLDINQKDKYGNTPLHCVRNTKLKNYFEITKLLLDAGADLLSRNNNGDTTAHLIASSNIVVPDDFKTWTTAMVKLGHGQLFTSLGYLDRTPLHCSMYRLDIDLETLRLITESSKLDLNQPDDNGYTILHLALCFGRKISTIKNILDTGADWEKKGIDDSNVLHYAVEGNNEEAFLYFKSLGANVNATNKYGQTPLHRVRLTKNYDFLGMTKFLLKNGADLNSRDVDGNTLHDLLSKDVRTEKYQIWKDGMVQLVQGSLSQEPTMSFI